MEEKERFECFCLPLAQEIFQALKEDKKHPEFYVSCLHAPHLLQTLLLLIQFLEIHVHLRRQIHHDNVEKIFQGVLLHIHPELSFDIIRENVHQVCFLLRQDFLYANLDRYIKTKKCFFM